MINRTVLLIGTIASVALLSYAGFHINWSKTFSPGPLSPAHKELDVKGKCNACHTKGKRLDTDKCLDCHQEIKSMIQKKRGLHARVTTKCEHCHSEHHIRLFNSIHFNENDFDHAMAGSQIGGKHRLLRCEVCHAKGSYLLNKHKCFQCHVDIHKGENGQDCAECHTQDTFKNVN
jgi:hypothetical protein